MTVRLGVTGTSDGITDKQLLRLHEFIAAVQATELHHGDCVGADAVAHFAVLNLRAWRMASGLPRTSLIIHPPDDDKKRAFCQDYDEIREPRPYLIRDHDIVDESDLLIAAPRTAEEELRSGTWATIRYARKKNVPVIIIDPDGGWHLDQPKKTGQTS